MQNWSREEFLSILISDGHSGLLFLWVKPSARYEYNGEWKCYCTTLSALHFVSLVSSFTRTVSIVFISDRHLEMICR